MLPETSVIVPCGISSAAVSFSFRAPLYRYFYMQRASPLYIFQTTSFMNLIHIYIHIHGFVLCCPSPSILNEKMLFLLHQHEYKKSLPEITCLSCEHLLEHLLGNNTYPSRRACGVDFSSQKLRPLRKPSMDKWNVNSTAVVTMKTPRFPRTNRAVGNKS